MKIAICDDTKKDLDLCLNLVKDYQKTNDKEIIISTFESGETFLQTFEKGKYDVVFLDIYMQNLTGVQVAQAIRHLDKEIRLIFITTSTDHFADGFAVEATHYLVKPLTTEKINETMYRLRNLFVKDEVFLTLPNGSKTLQIPENQILYIETIRNGIEIHSTQGSFPIRCSLSSVMKQLRSECFLQCHRYFVVNLHAVEKIGRASCRERVCQYV